MGFISMTCGTEQRGNAQWNLTSCSLSKMGESKNMERFWEPFILRHCFHFMRLFLLLLLLLFFFFMLLFFYFLNDDGVKTFRFTFFTWCSLFWVPNTYLLNTLVLSRSLSPSGSCEELISLVWCFSFRQLDGLPIKSRTNAVSVGRAIQFSGAMFQTTTALSLFLSVSLPYEKLFHFWQR